MPVTTLQALVLAYFAERDTADPHEAAAALGLEVTDVEKIIAELEAHGLLERPR